MSWWTPGALSQIFFFFKLMGGVDKMLLAKNKIRNLINQHSCFKSNEIFILPSTAPFCWEVFFFNLLILIRGQSHHSTVVAPATHWHGSATGAHGPPIPEPPPTSLPTPSLWVLLEYQLWVLCFMHQTCPGHLFNIW